ncbi:MAG: family 16 glycosylhydrolase [Rhodoferax sp.]
MRQFRTLLGVLAVCCTLITTACGGGGGADPTPVTPPTTDPTPPSSDWVLDWSDEFNGTALDSTVWTHDTGAGGWGNNESQYYQANNAVVSGGYLTITARRENVGGAPYTSSRIQSSRKKSFTYGRFEMRAKLPQSQGLWPAFWLLGNNCNSFNLYGGNTDWPGCGEIDAMEMIGGLSDGSGDYTTHGTLHYLNAQNINPMPSFAYRNATKLSDDFHIYRVDWTPQSFSWSIDGVTYGTKLITADMEAFHRPYFMLLNLAVGGNWGGWPDGTTVLPQTYVIDYVRHYTRNWPARGTASGLPSVWHLSQNPHLNAAAGTTTGAQPIVTLADSPLSWYTPFLSGSFDAGAWSASLWTLASAGSTPVRARIYRRTSAGTETLLGESTANPATSASGNHATRFNFVSVPAVTLANESVRFELTKLSGPSLSLVVNGNDFDSNLSMPWSASGTVAGYPGEAATAFPTPSTPPTTPGLTDPPPATLSVYADSSYASAWSGLTTAQSYNHGVVQAANSGAFEGANSLSCTLNSDGGGWQFVGAERDLSAYHHLRFMIKTSSAAQWVRVRLAGTGQVGWVALAGKLSGSTDWQEIVVPLSEFGAAAQGPVSVPFSLEAVGGTPDFSAQVDQIYFTTD